MIKLLIYVYLFIIFILLLHFNKIYIYFFILWKWNLQYLIFLNKYSFKNCKTVKNIPQYYCFCCASEKKKALLNIK